MGKPKTESPLRSSWHRIVTVRGEPGGQRRASGRVSNAAHLLERLEKLLRAELPILVQVEPLENLPEIPSLHERAALTMSAQETVGKAGGHRGCTSRCTSCRTPYFWLRSSNALWSSEIVIFPSPFPSILVTMSTKSLCVPLPYNLRCLMTRWSCSF